MTLEMGYEFRRFNQVSPDKNIYNVSNGVSNLIFTKNELLRAAYTVGRSCMDHVYSYPFYSEKEVSLRIAIMEAYIDLNSSPITISPAFDLLDPSEKGGFRFLIASAFSKLYAEKFLNVEFLMHLDVYRRNAYDDNGVEIKLKDGDRRPDFIGKSPRGWVAVESKGRVNKVANAITAGHEQLENLKTINGEAPIYKVVSMMHQKGRQIKMFLSDPEEAEDNSFNLQIKEANFIRDYYAVVMLELNEANVDTVKENAIEFYIIRNTCNQYEIGLAKVIYEKLKHFLDSDIANEINSLLKGVVAETTDIDYIGNDGIYFKSLH
ncbi:hypothetical protein ACE1TF_13695 [Geomicrobium sp. JSM 1781026]|uniref:hypothetical protein n=1 Tax=Geomicrobium sp. JSM 1781026 TaxID=3344580 RepID=UPI0035C189CE